MSEQANQNQVPEAVMLLATHCPHCEAVMRHLAAMVKEGHLARLQLINIEQDADALSEWRVRSVPWVRIGDYELSGAQTREALMQRVDWIRERRELEGQVDHWLSEAQADKALEHLRDDAAGMKAILALLGDPATVLSTRIGIGVVMEEFAGSEMLKDAVPELQRLTRHEDARIRADACHYLGLSHTPDVIPSLERCLKDEDPEVREVAADSLESLRE